MEQNENPPEKRYHKFSADLTQSCTDLADIALTRQRSASMQEPDNLNLSDITSQISNISDNNLSLLRPTLQLRPQDLTFEKFYRTDVSQLFLSVLGHETKLFSHVNYKIQCIVGSYPPFFIYKRYSEFRALHKALRIRFENVDWPEMPSKFQIIKKVEKRIQAFDKVVKKIIEVVRSHSSVKKSLLGLLFAFLFDEENKKRLAQDHGKKSSDSLNNSSIITARRNSQGDEDSDNEELEKKLLNLDLDRLNTEESDSKSDLGKSMTDLDARSRIPQRKDSAKSNGSDNSKSIIQRSEVKLREDKSRDNSMIDVSIIQKTINAQAIRKLSAEEDIDNRIFHHQMKRMIDKLNFSDSDTEEKTDINVAKLENEKTKKLVKEVSKLKKKEIPNFAGEIWMKFQSDDKWKKYYGRINDNFLNLHPSIVDNNIVVMIPCYMINITYVKGSPDRLVLKHHYDSEALELSIEPDHTRDEQRVGYAKYLKVWLHQLKIASEKLTGLDFENINYNPIGKIQIQLCESGNFRGLPQNSILYVKIRHTPFKLNSKKCLFSKQITWDQKFHLPLIDHFFKIYFDVYCIYNDGWIKESQKEEIVCTGSLLVGDLLASHEHATLKIKLPLEYTETRKKALEKLASTSKSNGEQVGEPYLKLKIKNLCSNKTYFGSSAQNYIEGVKYDPEVYVKYNLRVALHRLKTLFAKIALEIDKVQDVVHFKYPIFSIFAMLMMVWLILTLDVNSILNNFVIFIILVTIYNYPGVNQWVHKKLDEKIFNSEHLNPHYKEPLVETVDQVQQKKLADMNRFKARIEDPDSLYTTLKKIKNMLAQLTIAMMQIANFMEKTKNLVCWVDQYRTFYFVAAATLAYCALNAFTLRLIILIGTINAFVKGMSYYKKTYSKNYKIAKLTMQFIFKRYFPDQISYLNEPNSLWPPAINFGTLQKKVVEQMRFRLNLELPDNALVMYQTMESLLKAIATCSTHLKFHIEPGEEMDFEALPQKKPPKITVKTLCNYIWNIPSDYFRLLHPRKVYRSTD